MLETTSLLDGAYIPGVYGANKEDPGVILERRTQKSITQIAAWPETVNTVAADLEKTLKLNGKPRPGHAVHADTGTVLMTAPFKFLAISSSDEWTSLPDKYSADQAVCLDLSHSFTVLQISGHSVCPFLNRGITLDLEAVRFPVRATAITALESISVILHHRDTAIYDLYIPRAYGRSVLTWIQETGFQFGLDIR